MQQKLTGTNPYSNLLDSEERREKKFGFIFSCFNLEA